MLFARRFTHADGEYGDVMAPRDATFDSGEEDWSIPFRRAVSMARGVVEVVCGKFVASSLREVRVGGGCGGAGGHNGTWRRREG
jgi:hypothetical protein